MNILDKSPKRIPGEFSERIKEKSLKESLEEFHEKLMWEFSVEITGDIPKGFLKKPWENILENP